MTSLNSQQVLAKRTPRLRWVAIGLLLVVAVVAAWLAPKLVRRYYHHGLALITVAAGLDTPWAMAFLPDQRLLVTERVGRLRIVERDGTVGPPLTGLPPVYAQGEGGLMDVVLDPSFSTNQRIYWSYSEPATANEGRAGTAVARGRLGAAGVDDVLVIFREPVKETDSRHFGSRLLFAPDGRLFVSVGDRMVRDDAQQAGSTHGKLLRIEPDGRAPPDNPFASTPGALPTIWSLGHRNVQGLVLQPGTGALWASEHGPQGGDEINLIRPGGNYGWPVVTHGCEYTSCAKIGEGVQKPGMASPLTWWGPESVPPTGMAFLTSDRYPQWKGQLFVGALHGPSLTRLRVDADKVLDKAPMWAGVYRRIRDVKQGPDGWLYLVVNSPDGRIIRLEQ
jgi:aldose sugar dehydrogenase